MILKKIKYLLKRCAWFFMCFLALLVEGCSTHAVVCPEYPVPSPHVIEQLTPLVLQDQEVNQWFNDLFKLQQKLEVCK